MEDFRSLNMLPTHTTSFNSVGSIMQCGERCRLGSRNFGSIDILCLTVLKALSRREELEKESPHAAAAKLAISDALIDFLCGAILEKHILLPFSFAGFIPDIDEVPARAVPKFNQGRARVEASQSHGGFDNGRVPRSKRARHCETHWPPKSRHHHALDVR